MCGGWGSFMRIRKVVGFLVFSYINSFMWYYCCIKYIFFKFFLSGFINGGKNVEEVFIF